MQLYFRRLRMVYGREVHQGARAISTTIRQIDGVELLLTWHHAKGTRKSILISLNIRSMKKCHFFQKHI